MGYVEKKKTTAPRATAKRASKPSGAINGQGLHQQEVMHRLRRVEGQIRGVLTMMEQDLPCDAIAQQLSAARKALDRAFYEMMACSLEMEIGEAASSKDIRVRIAEKARLLAKYA
ncbi:DNA-binding FrmR family transcriptional regulator [Panacagrimonas perspica]|uniref:DNA-binding FrmR family transcriptional regulator n=1 Tax=Panacagrimonas perspica TaxID=381431 RepID=A0A4R7NTW2_9GAMM|nr:metal-sensitive transcriptional regulator [Panacagrimonas perspica]TDU24182.1 DNA-binding FrmR family transcriptional regulator [Panacagrimonas perspica]